MASSTSRATADATRDAFRVLRDRIYLAIRLPAARSRALWEMRSQEIPFGDVRTFCLFLGYPRSGHSLVAALLNAHPRMVVSHEFHALRATLRGMDRESFFRRIVATDRAFARAHQRWEGYRYQVPGQWQGRFERIEVIGDKKGSASGRLLRKAPDALERLRRVVGVPVRLLHVVRNPFDSLATISRLHGKTLPTAIDFYFRLGEVVRDVRQRGEFEILDIRLEEFVAAPRSGLARACRFLGVEADPAYLEACASIVFPELRPTRRTVRWNRREIETVHHRMRDFDFLERYGWEDG